MCASFAVCHCRDRFDEWPTPCSAVRLQDHNYTAPLPCTPPLSPPSPIKVGGGGGGGVARGGGGFGLLPLDDPTAAGSTAPGIKEVVVTTTTTPGDPVVDDSVTRCICDFQHDDGYMICCDQCGCVSIYITLH